MEEANLNSQNNPANSREIEKRGRPRIPMSVPQLKLSVPDIPGYHLHWMLGTPERLAQAHAAGYEFVDSDEVKVNNSRGFADDAEESGSTDMGSRVTVVAGGDTDSGGQSIRLVLMKLREEWWQEDQKKLEARSDELAQALRAGNRLPGDDGDGSNRYLDRNRTTRNMFQRRA